MAAARQPTRRPTGRWWLRWVVFAVLLGLGAAVAVDLGRGGVTQTWLRYVASIFVVARGEEVEIRPGHSLYLDCRGEGAPTLILEAGMGSDTSTWSPVHDSLAGITRTCAYDRTGRGRSDGGSAGDLDGMSDELAALMAAAGEPPPYVVVGHSLGSVIGRVHASRHREDVAGLVLVDGFDPDIFDSAVVPRLGPMRRAYVDHTARLWALVASVEGIDVARSRDQLAAANLVGLPIEVVLAARYEGGLDAAANEEIAAATGLAYSVLSPGHVTLTIAEFSGHMVQFDRPDLVVEAVRRIVVDVRADLAG
jgi:pimeloyl-ACP methyl ester carboxylesterase